MMGKYQNKGTQVDEAPPPKTNKQTNKNKPKTKNKTNPKVMTQID